MLFLVWCFCHTSDHYSPTYCCQWNFIFTIRNEVAKVMFLHLSVSHSVHNGGLVSHHALRQSPSGTESPGRRHPSGLDTPPGTDTTPPGSRHHLLPQSRHPPPGGDGYCCGRYASYWNAFLLQLTLLFWVRYLLKYVALQEYKIWN